jgi:hypothetical protein
LEFLGIEKNLKVILSNFQNKTLFLISKFLGCTIEDPSKTNIRKYRPKFQLAIGPFFICTFNAEKLKNTSQIFEKSINENLFWNANTKERKFLFTF